MELKIIKQALPNITQVKFVFNNTDQVFRGDTGDTHFDAKENILLVGLGKPKQNNNSFQSQILQLQCASNPISSSMLSALLDACKMHSIENIIIPVSSSNVRALAESIGDIMYQYPKDQASPTNEKSLKQIYLLVEGANNVSQEDLLIANVINKAKEKVRTLTMSPPNICTTDYMLSNIIETVKKSSASTYRVLDESNLLDEGMNCFLAVGRGSRQPTYMVIAHYNNSSNTQEPTVMVGKGVVFDSGGLNIKTGRYMYGMHTDMGGAAVVLGVLQAAQELELPINLICVFCLAENAVGPNSYRPGEVIKSHKGKTVEIIDTDAEGRLLLCDALSYVSKYQPKELIDIATLTGSIAYSLGESHTGMFTNSDVMFNEMIKAAIQSNDLVWPMPLTSDYSSRLKSYSADISHLGSGGSGATTAALFLQEFVTCSNWVHLDIAGTMRGDKQQGPIPTGRSLALLVQYLINQI